MILHSPHPSVSKVGNCGALSDNIVIHINDKIFNKHIFYRHCLHFDILINCMQTQI